MADYRNVPWETGHLSRAGVHLTCHIITSKQDGLIALTVMYKKPTMAETERGHWFYLYSRLLGDVWLTIYVIGKGDRLTSEYVKNMLYAWLTSSPQWVKVDLTALGTYTKPSRDGETVREMTNDDWERVLREFAK